MGLKMNIAKTKMMVVDNITINVDNVLIENVEGYIVGKTLQSQGNEPEQRDTTKNHGRLGSIRQTPGHLQKRPCHLPEETGTQLLCAASYDIWCRYLDTDQTSTEQTCGRKDQNAQQTKKYAQNHTVPTRIEIPTSGSGRGQSHRYNNNNNNNNLFQTIYRPLHTYMYSVSI